MKDPELIIIAAVSENNVIGKEGKVPWHIKEDSERFKRLTMNHFVIMGRKTYESIPIKFRPLPQRKNIVLSESLEEIPGSEIFIARNIREAINLAEGQNAYIIGGEKVYRDFMHLTSIMEITKVQKEFEGDAFFPKIDQKEWKLESESEKMISKDGVPYSFLTYNRR